MNSTRISIVAAVAAAALCPLSAQACTVRSEPPLVITEIAALDTSIVAGDYAELQADIAMLGGPNASAIIDFLNANFPKGFNDCFVLLQRKEIGGMRQGVTRFTTDDADLYVYWLSAIENGRFRLLSVSMNRSLDELLQEVR